MLIYIEPKTELKMRTEETEEVIIRFQFADLVAVIQKIVERRFPSSGNFIKVFGRYPNKDELKVRYAVVFVAKKYSKGNITEKDMSDFLGGLPVKAIKKSLEKHGELFSSDDSYRNLVEDLTHQVSCVV